MAGMFFKWIVFGVITCISVTAAAIATTGASVPSDLTLRSVQALGGETLHWAHTSFSGRDAILSGTATDTAEVEAAVAAITAVHGVRSVTTKAELAPHVAPYPFTATLREGQVTISGGTPDNALVSELATEAGATAVDLKLMSGAPERTLWRTAVGYGIKYLRQFDEGKFELSGLVLTIAGRAKSQQAFDTLAILSRAAPAGVEVAALQVMPPFVSPYDWHATFDGKVIAVSGLAPDDVTIDAMRAAVRAPVSTSLVLASGEPENFRATTILLLQNLSQLERGVAAIVDGEVSLSGAPPSKEVAQAITENLNSANSIVTLAPPRVPSYVFTASRADGKTVLSGYVPDEETEQRLATSGADVGGLELARGAPERFDAVLDFGLSILGHVSAGRFAFRDGVITLKGRAATNADLEAVNAALADGPPQGAILAMAEIRPPLATPFLWSAEKKAGGIAIGGFVPSTAAKMSLLSAAGLESTDVSVIADGAPDEFDASAKTGLRLLSMLDRGKVSYDGKSWSLTGVASTPLQAKDADAAFAESGLKDAGWTYAVALPVAAQMASIPVITAYTFKVEKLPAGTIAMSGYVPNPGLRSFLALRAGKLLVDSTKVASGAPHNFPADAVAGLKALLTLEEGELLLKDGVWSLTGEAVDPELPATVRGTLSGSVGISNWKVSIKAPEPLPPIANPFTWSATRQTDGSYALTGHVGNNGFKRYLGLHVGAASGGLKVARGEPEGFVTDALVGLAAVGRLQSGSVEFDGTHWSLSGTPQTAQDRAAAIAALSGGHTVPEAWIQMLDEPLTPTSPEPKVAEEAPLAQDTKVAVSALETATEQAVASAADLAAAAKTAAAPVAAEPPVDASAPEAAAEVASPAAEPLPELAKGTEPKVVAVGPPSATVSERFVLGAPIFNATRADAGPLALSGVVPTAAAGSYFGVIAGQVPTDALRTAEDLPPDYIPNATAGIHALTQLSTGSLSFDGTHWSLRGTADTDMARQSAIAALEGLPQAGSWVTDVSLTPPVELCRREVTNFSARNSILFQSGSATMTEESVSALDELAGYLSTCRDTSIDVEGHTDADGPQDVNLALSVSRAEAVVGALVAKGVAESRLYAIGYGESMPVADNDTKAGKQANRRIVFMIAEENL